MAEHGLRELFITKLHLACAQTILFQAKVNSLLTGLSLANTVTCLCMEKAGARLMR